MMHVDDSEWPLVVLTFVETFDLDTAEAYIELTEELMNRGRFAELVFLERLGLPQVGAVKRVAQHTKAQRGRLSEQVVATAIVTHSAMLRGALGFAQQLAESSSPERVFNTEAEARAWLAEMLDSQ